MRGPTRADCVRQSDALPSRDEPHDTGAADRHGRGGAHQCTAVARRSTRVCCGAAGAGWLWRPTVVVARTETTVRVCELRDHVWAEVVAHKPRDHPLWKIKAILLHFNDWLNLKSTKFNTLTLPYSTRTRGLSSWHRRCLTRSSLHHQPERWLCSRSSNGTQCPSAALLLGPPRAPLL